MQQNKRKALVMKITARCLCLIYPKNDQANDQEQLRK